MINWLPYAYERWAFLTLAAAALFVGCHPGIDAPGVPLYPNAGTTRLPSSQIALVSGPIAKIDGQDVVEQGGRFELLPGCHVVELDRRVLVDSSLSAGTYWSGEFPITIYAIQMKAGARYAIRRDIDAGGLGARVSLSAREEAASGAVTDLVPEKSMEAIKACK